MYLKVYTRKCETRYCVTHRAKANVIQCVICTSYVAEPLQLSFSRIPYLAAITVAVRHHYYFRPPYVENLAYMMPIFLHS